MSPAPFPAAFIAPTASAMEYMNYSINLILNPFHSLVVLSLKGPSLSCARYSHDYTTPSLYIYITSTLLYSLFSHSLLKYSINEKYMYMYLTPSFLSLTHLTTPPPPSLFGSVSVSLSTSLYYGTVHGTPLSLFISDLLCLSYFSSFLLSLSLYIVNAIPLIIRIWAKKNAGISLLN